MNGWISVKERFPEDYEDVLVCWRGGDIQIAFHISNMKNWYLSVPEDGWISDDTNEFWCILAWQPLPEAFEE